MKINRTRFYVCFLGLWMGLFLTSPATAQQVKNTTESPLQWRLIGRAFFDGGFFMNNRLDLGSSFQVNDLRLGAILNIYEDWEAKIELGYGNKEVSFKDIYLSYDWKGHLFKLGYQYEPFGYARIGSANYRFMEHATADKAIGTGRKLGISYSRNFDWFHFMGGVFSAGNIQTSGLLDQGYSLAAKVVFRPVMKDNKLVHIGVAPVFTDGKSEISFSGGVPTMLLAGEDNAFLDATVDHVINQWKLDIEGIFLYNKWYLQGQYFLSHLNRSATDNYNAQGAYVQAGYLLCGERHNYNANTAMMGNPAPQSLELLVRYDYVDLNDAGIVGGQQSDITVGLNYFFNKYIAAKINYTRMMVEDSSPRGKNNFDVLQARIQLSF